MYKVIWEADAEEDLSKIDKETARKIRNKVDSVLPKNPKIGKAMTGNWQGCYRITYGRYRIIYEIHETILLVVVVKAGHRKNVYEGKMRRSTFLKQSTTTERPQARDLIKKKSRQK